MNKYRLILGTPHGAVKIPIYADSLEAAFWVAENQYANYEYTDVWNGWDDE